MEGRKLVQKGLRILIGNGSETKLWDDLWLPIHPPRPPIPIDDAPHTFHLVSDLMNDSHNGWDDMKLSASIIPEERQIIERIRLSSQNIYDLLGWHYTSSDIYTVKSRYWLATHSDFQQVDIPPPPGLLEFQEKIWKLKTAPKLKHFLWRLFSNALAIGTTLSHRGIITAPQCRSCCNAEESMDHLFTCDYAQAIWRGARLPNLTLIDRNSNFETKFRALLESNANVQFSHFHRQLPLWILWRIWKSRNELLYQKRGNHWSQDLRKAEFDTHEWDSRCQDSLGGYGIHNKDGNTNSSSCWTKPQAGYFKYNYDCRFRKTTTSYEAWIFRDSDGFFKKTGHSQGNMVSSVIEAQLQVLLMAIRHAWCRGYKKVIFEGDNKTVFNLLTNKEVHFGVHNWI